MKMKRNILAVLLAMCLMFSLSFPAFAEGETFNAYLDVTQNPDGSITVTIPSENAAVLEAERPTLSIPCSLESPIVTKDGAVVPSTFEGEFVSFVVETAGTYVITGAPEERVTLRGLSLIFGDIPQLKYYSDVPDSLLNDPDAYFAFFDPNGAELSRALISTGEDAVYKGTPCTAFYFSVVPKKAETTVNLRFFDGNGSAVPLFTASGADYSEQGFPYSMNAYAEYLEAHGETDLVRNLASALDDYCAAAVTYFRVGNSPVSSALANVSAETLNEYTVVKTGTLPAGIVKPQMSVLFEEDNSIRIYFVYDANSSIDPQDYTYAIDDHPATLMENAGRYYLTVTGIAAKALGVPHDFSVSDGTDTYHIQASALTYAKLLIGQTDEAEQNLGRALYLYAKAAEAYFANN